MQPAAPTAVKETYIPPPAVPGLSSKTNENAVPAVAKSAKSTKPAAATTAAAPKAAPKPRKRKSDESTSAPVAAPAAKKAKATKATPADPLDVSGVAVPANLGNVYDTCNEVRRKIRLMLNKEGVTQASFLRAISAYNPQGSDKKIVASSLRTFVDKKRPNALDGNTSCVYPAAYALLELIRIRDGKPKTEHRNNMERVWHNGVDVSRSFSGGFWCRGGERPVMDQFGQIRFN